MLWSPWHPWLRDWCRSSRQSIVLHLPFSQKTNACNKVCFTASKVAKNASFILNGLKVFSNPNLSMILWILLEVIQSYHSNGIHYCNLLDPEIIPRGLQWDLYVSLSRIAPASCLKISVISLKKEISKSNFSDAHKICGPCLMGGLEYYTGRIKWPWGVQ